jgi:hypothetical protein
MVISDFYMPVYCEACEAGFPATLPRRTATGTVVTRDMAHRAAAALEEMPCERCGEFAVMAIYLNNPGDDAGGLGPEMFGGVPVREFGVSDAGALELPDTPLETWIAHVDALLEEVRLSPKAPGRGGAAE